MLLLWQIKIHQDRVMKLISVTRNVFLHVVNETEVLAKDITVKLLGFTIYSTKQEFDYTIHEEDEQNEIGF